MIAIKKPIQVECYRVDYDNIEFLEDWCDIEYRETGLKYRRYFIRTLEGVHECSEGDYIIKGVEGEFYPIKKEIFEKTYEIING